MQGWENIIKVHVFDKIKRKKIIWINKRLIIGPGSLACPGSSSPANIKTIEVEKDSEERDDNCSETSKDSSDMLNNNQCSDDSNAYTQSTSETCTTFYKNSQDPSKSPNHSHINSEASSNSQLISKHFQQINKSSKILEENASKPSNLIHPFSITQPENVLKSKLETYLSKPQEKFQNGDELSLKNYEQGKSV